jgi:hypothetical protein
MMVLVSDLPGGARCRDAWNAQACNPADVNSLAAVMTWCVEHREQVRAMGEAGRRRILAEWNYERQFHDVAQALQLKRSS